MKDSPCQYDLDPRSSITLRDVAPGHDHAPILLVVTSRDKLLAALLSLNMLVPYGQAYLEALRYTQKETY